MYENMAELLEDRAEGDFKLERFEIPKNDLYAMMHGIPPGTFMRLTHRDEVVMSDTEMEKQTNQSFVISANGDVLIGGLGIGMIILAIQDKPEVTTITVIEKYQEVITMVASQLSFNVKVTIVNADVFDWKPKKGTKFDTVYMDIWNWINTDVYQEEMQPLKRKYARYLKSKDASPKRFNKCWAEYKAKNGLRL